MEIFQCHVRLREGTVQLPRHALLKSAVFWTKNLSALGITKHVQGNPGVASFI